MDGHRDLIKQMLTVIDSEFKNESHSKQQMELRAKMWLEILKVYPTQLISIAFKQVMSEAVYPPHIGDITNKIREIKEAQLPSPNELWAELEEAFRKADIWIYQLATASDKTQAREEVTKIYDGMSEELKTYCVSVSNFVRIFKDRNEYEKGRFLKALPEIRKKKILEEELPQLKEQDEHRRLQG